MAHPVLRLAPALALVVMLGGCLSFGAKPPKSLLALQSTAQAQPGQTQSSARGRAIVVQVPVVPQTLVSARIPVQTGATVSYVPDAAWTEPPARLFARLLADTLTARANMVVLSPAQSFSEPSANLGGELRNFGVDAGTREAVVTYDASLTRAGSETVEKRRFEARVAVAAIDGPSAGAALAQAANQVGGEVAAWAGGAAS